MIIFFYIRDINMLYKDENITKKLFKFKSIFGIYIILFTFSKVFSQIKIF